MSSYLGIPSTLPPAEAVTLPHPFLLCISALCTVGIRGSGPGRRMWKWQAGLKSGSESKWKGSVKAHCVVAKAQFGTVDTYSGGVEGLKADVADLHHFDALIKKKTKFSSLMRKFRWDRLQSHILIYEEGLPNVWGNAQIFNHKWGGPETYMTLQPIPSAFTYTVYKGL